MYQYGITASFHCFHICELEKLAYGTVTKGLTGVWLLPRMLPKQKGAV